MKKLLNIALVLLTGSLILTAHSALAHDNDTGNSKICGISNIPLDNIGNAIDGSNPLEAKSDFLSEGAIEVNTCDFRKGIAVSFVMNNGTKWALIFK